MISEDTKKPKRSRFQRHVSALVWKCYLQRQRRWRLLVIECVFAFFLCLLAVFIAKPVFLTPLQAVPKPPLASADILASVTSSNLLGYAPNTPPYDAVMVKVAHLLQAEIFSGRTEEDLNAILYNRSMGTPIKNPVMWIIFQPQVGNIWKFSIRSTERAKYLTSADSTAHPNPHLRAGFLGVQLAVSQAILEYSSPSKPKYQLSLVSMPVSPLMQEEQVVRCISGILMCLTVALIPPVIETQALVVTETLSGFKRGLRMRNVDFSSIYISWLVYAYLTAVPICLLASLTLILIFRWIHIFFALIILLAYISVMIMLALILAMFHIKASIACLWSVLFTLLQTFLAELLVHHKYDLKHKLITSILHLLLPPLGLVHALNEFALLQTGRGATQHSLFYMIFSWVIMNLIYFGILMLMQRTMAAAAIGGQVSWKSIIFKKIQDSNKLHQIHKPSAIDNAKLQEMDDLLAKAISFRNISKSVMKVPMLTDISLDIYRGEFTMLFSERIQEKMITTIEDLLTGLTFQDDGIINILGQITTPESYLMAVPNMMGYCHRSEFLIDDLTVEEHIVLFSDICLWHESKQFVTEYIHIRTKRLLSECDLESVWRMHVQKLGYYYRAQLCWALALLLEPRIIYVPKFMDKPSYIRVIKDKIMHYKKYVSIVMASFTSIQLEYADRVFIFDNKILVFGGSPAYMFFKYGREYRLRMTFRHNALAGDDSTSDLLNRAMLAGATIRAHLGSLMILRIPSSPTAKVAAFLKELDNNVDKYGITSLSISLPDSEEVSRRAIYESRAAVHLSSTYHQNLVKEALKKIADPLPWKRLHSPRISQAHLRVIGRKFLSFYLYHKAAICITLLSTILTGIFIGISLSSILSRLYEDRYATKILHGEVLTVEYLQTATTLVLRADNTYEAREIAASYVLSETKAKKSQIENMVYTAIAHSESLTEYLVTRAIDSPQQYVYMYAYGMEVSSEGPKGISIQALYSPIHRDRGAAARSLARVFMALIRYFTQSPDASIEVTDEPLSLDLTPWMEYASKPPLLIQFLLILTISHMTLLPSKEYGIVRHTQCHAANFSPAKYWFLMCFYDAVLYLMLVVVMTVILGLIIRLTVPLEHFELSDFIPVPVLLIVYGLSCIPQAYLFSLGPMAALNTMTFIMINIVFGETTVIAKLFYGQTLHFALYIMRLSPQFNMAYAYVKIKQIFLYNSECVIFKSKKFCSAQLLHKCCTKCGVLQECFKPKHYFTWKSGILIELISMVGTAVLFMTLLLCWEHRIIQRLFKHVTAIFISIGEVEQPQKTEGAEREKADVMEKLAQIKSKRNEKVVTFGEYLLAVNITRKAGGIFTLRNAYFGLGKGEVLALSGLKRHGRMDLVHLIGGYKMNSAGEIWSMSKWKLKESPHMYNRNVSMCCEKNTLPQWMAVLRGVPTQYVHEEVQTYIDALELHDLANTRIWYLLPNEKARLHFAAAVVAAPPVQVLDESTAYQKYSVRRAMYYIMFMLKKRGHAIFTSSSNVESHLPITNRLAILVDGYIYDIDHIDDLVERYSNKGCTVVVHLKDEVEVSDMFARYFNNFVINDMSEVLVNIQVYDSELSWSEIFAKMERLKAENPQVYSYIISAIPIDYIYNSILSNEKGLKYTKDLISLFCLKNMFATVPEKKPTSEVMDRLTPFKKKFDITQLNELPWSVIFQR